MIFGKNISKYYLKYWYFFVIGIIAIFVVDYIGHSLPPKIIGHIIDTIDSSSMDVAAKNEAIGRMILQLLVIGLIQFAFRFLWRMGFIGASNFISTDLRHKLFAKSLTLSQTFYSDNKVGGLMSYYMNDVQSIRETFGFGTLMVFDTLILIPIVLINMFKLNPAVTWISMIPLSMILLSGILIGSYMEKKYKARQDKFEELSDFAQESFSGIRVIKAFVRERNELKNFAKLNKENKDINISFFRLSILYNTIDELFIWVMYFAVICVGSYYVLKGNDVLSLGDLTALVAYFDTLIWPMFAIGDVIRLTSQGKASVKRVNEILEAKCDLIEPENPIEFKNFKGGIKFNHLSFKYPDSKDIYALNDINVEIKPGEFVGIIGKTGSSKTTLVNLLLRLYNVDKGQLFLDDVDIMDISIKDVREVFGYVPQDNFLYSASIESNIAFSDLDKNMDKDKVQREARISGVHNDIVAFPDGYSTKLEERGVSVSGGQKQRISIARALYKNPACLIMDDSLSAVDTKTESEILEFLKEDRKGKTTILIAHRISSIKDCDKILVLDDGGVVSGFDTHENLLLNNKIYHDTYILQKLDEEGGIQSV